MDEKYKKIVILVVIVAVMFNVFVLMPYLHNRQATSIAKKILDLWNIGDSAAGVHYFKEETKFPPIYDLVNYKIIGKAFGKHAGRKYAVFYVNLRFADTNVLPTNKTWVCELRHEKKGGWKVLSFYIHKDSLVAATY